VFNFGGPLLKYDETLASQSVDGIVTAYNKPKEHARPGTALVVRSAFASNLQRNRAIDALFRNPEADQTRVLDVSRAGNTACPDGAAAPCPRFQAVDPALTAMQVMRGERRFGVLVFYAILDTAIPTTSRSINPISPGTSSNCWRIRTTPIHLSRAFSTAPRAIFHRGGSPRIVAIWFASVGCLRPPDGIAGRQAWTAAFTATRFRQ